MGRRGILDLVCSALLIAATTAAPQGSTEAGSSETVQLPQAPVSYRVDNGVINGFTKIESPDEPPPSSNVMLQDFGRVSPPSVDSNLLEGDIMSNGGAEYCKPPTSSQRKRVKRKVDGKTWPGGVVPYQFSNTYIYYQDSNKDMIRTAMNWWEQHTCVRFVPNGTANVGHSIVLTIQSYSGCSSYVGFQDNAPNNEQLLNLVEAQCFTKTGTPAHELGHALGLIHEQSRMDRDTSVKIWPERVNPSSLFNYQMYQGSRIPAGVYYDLSSIMHYNPTSFAIYPNQPTITSRNPNKQDLMGQRDALGYYDIKAINMEYNCRGTCTNSCDNEGYPRMLDGRCICVCPEGLKGSRCELVDSNCGGAINLRSDEKQTLASPNYPNPPGRTKCIWLITTPQDQLVQITFNQFDVRSAQTPSASSQRCKHSVEVRNNILGQRGDIYCGNGPLGPFTTRLDFKRNQMMVVLDTNDLSETPGAGFSATVSAYRDACLSDPCFNGATCTAIGALQYSCLCPQGYGGQNCEKVLDGAVSCDFSEGMCMFANSADDSIDFSRIFTSNKYKEPISHNTRNNLFFIGAPIEYQTAIGATAKIISPVFSASAVQKRCISFAMYMDGAYQDQGRLSVQVIDAQTRIPRSIYQAFGKQGPQWNTITREITNSRDYQVAFLLETSDEDPYNSLIALDDIDILPHGCSGGPCSIGPCQADGSVCVEESATRYHCLCPLGKAGTLCTDYDTSGFTCTFEDSGMCGWQQDKNDNFDWDRYFGPSDSLQRTGPTGGVSGSTYYMVADTSSLNASPGNSARLISPQLKYTGRLCLSFFYNMWGDNVGTLSVKLQTGGQLPAGSVWSKSGAQGKDWLFTQAEFDVTSKSTQVVFEATAGTRHLSDIAIDNVKMSQGACSSGSDAASTTRARTDLVIDTSNLVAAVPARGIPPALQKTTSRATQLANSPASGFVSQSSPIDFSCDFEEGNLCSYTNSKDDDLDWDVSWGKTPTDSTGPNAAYSGTKYIYMESSYPAKPGNKAQLLSPFIPANSGAVCLTFYLHMYGDGMGSLRVYKSFAKNVLEQVYTKSGNQGNTWMLAQLTLPSSATPYQVLFEAMISTGQTYYLSDIAMDRISIRSGSC